MNIQVMYKSEVKPKLYIFEILASCMVFIVLFIISLITSNPNNKFIGLIFILIPILLTIVLNLPDRIKYNKAIKNKNMIIQSGIKYKGRIIDVVTTSKTIQVGKKRQDKEVFKHCAVIEYVNANGKKTTFVTPALNENPKDISTKAVTVYVYNNAEYATDFGYIQKYNDRSRSLI